MRYLIKFSYDGTRFHGFQRQKDVKNVQGTLEVVLSKVLDEPITIKGSGRTDAGVHAKMQCAHFDTDKIIGHKDIDKINELESNTSLYKEISDKTYKIVEEKLNYEIFSKSLNEIIESI